MCRWVTAKVCGLGRRNGRPGWGQRRRYRRWPPLLSGQTMMPLVTRSATGANQPQPQPQPASAAAAAEAAAAATATTAVTATATATAAVTATATVDANAAAELQPQPQPQQQQQPRNHPRLASRRGSWRATFTSCCKHTASPRPM